MWNSNHRFATNGVRTCGVADDLAIGVPNESYGDIYGAGRMSTETRDYPWPF